MISCLLILIGLLASPQVSARQLREFRKTHPPIMGGATLTAVAGGGNWSAGATWGGSAPTAADDVVLASTSGNVVIDTATCVCRSLDCQATGNYAGTLSSTAGSQVSIGTSTANASNIAMRFSTTMTWSPSSATTLALRFVSTSATQQTITTAGRTMNTESFNGVGGSWLLSDSWTMNSLSTLTLTAGTLNTNALSHSWGLYASASASTRTLTITNSTITLTGTGTVWNVGTSSSTLNAAGSTLSATGASATVVSTAGTLTYGAISMTGSGNASIQLTSPATCTNFTRTGTAVKTDTLAVAADLTATGTVTLTGNSLTNRLLVQGNPVATQRTITAAVVSLTNVDFMDIAGAGAATWSGSSIGNCQGNTGITFTAAVTRYGVVAGVASSTATWSATSGGAGGASVPLPQDSVFFNASSAAGTYQVDVPRMPGIDCTGFTRTLNVSLSSAVTYFGNFTLAAGTTFVQSNALTFAGRGSQTFTTAGKTLNSVIWSGPGGTYTLQDDLSIGSANMTLSDGTIDANGHNLTCFNFISQSGRARGITMGSGTWTLNGTGTLWSITNGSTFTVNAGTSVLAITNTSATAKTFSDSAAGVGKAYNTLTITPGAGTLTMAGGTTATPTSFNRINLTGGAQSVIWTAGQTFVVTPGGWNVSGVAGSLVTHSSTTPGTQATISVASGTVSCDYCSFKDSNATGGATFYAGDHSTFVSNVTGWNLFAPPIIETAAESFAMADSAVVSRALPRPAAESIAVSDAASSRLSAARAAAESVGVGDAAAAPRALPRAASESMLLADSADGQLAVARPALEAFSVADAAARGLAMARAAGETLAVADSATTVATAARDALEALAISDAVGGVVSAARVAPEAFTTSDAAASSAVLPRQALEAFVIDDSVASQFTAGTTAFTRSALETFTVADSASSATALARAGAEAWGIGDVASRGAEFVRDAQEVIAVDDSAVARFPARRAVAEMFSVGDAAVAQLTLTGTETGVVASGGLAGIVVPGPRY